MKEIPISISAKVNDAEISKALFGLGEKVTEPEILKHGNLSENTRYINSETEIIDGVIIKKVKGEKIITEAYIPVGEVMALISWLGTGITIGDLSYKISNWLIDKTHNLKDVEIKVNGKKVINKEEIKTLLEELLKDD